MSVTRQQAVSLLENVLFESATQAAANAGAWLANPAASSVSSLAAAMANSGEEKIAATVVGYYLSALGRAPSAAEIRYYVGIAEQGLTQAQIAASAVPNSTWDTISQYFSHSPEFTARGGLDATGGLDQTGLLLQAVPWLYESVLGRAASTAEVSYYDNQILGGSGLGVLFREFTASPEFHTDTDAQIAAALATYGSAAASGQQPPATIGSAVALGPQPPTPPSTPTPSSTVFTTGTDTLTSTDTHTYTATLGGGSPTLTANDSLHGAGNTLAITDTSGPASQDMLPTGLSLTGVPTVTLTTQGNAGTDSSHPFDLSGIAGLTSFSLESSGTQGDFLDTGSTTSVSITAHGTNDVLDITSDTLATLTLSGTVSAVTLTDPAGPTALTVDISGLNLSGGLTDADNHITSLTIAGSGGASSIGALADTALTTLTVTGDVTLGGSGAPIVLTENGVTVSAAGDAGAVHLATQGSGVTGTAGGVNASADSVDIFGGTGGTGGQLGNDSLILGGADNTVTLGGTGGTGGTGGSASGNNGAIPNYDAGIGGTGGSVGQDHVALGDGNNVVVIDSTGGNGGTGGAASTGAVPNSLAVAGNGGNGGNGGGDTVVLGDGNNTVTDNSKGGDGGDGGAATITTNDTSGVHVADGGNGGNGGSGGGNVIVAGNGANVITDNSSAGAPGAGGNATDVTQPFEATPGGGGNSGGGGNDTIVVGTGTNTVNLNGHANDTVVVDVDAAYDSSNITPNQIINGAVAGDIISFRNDAAPGSGTVPATLSVTLVTPDISGTVAPPPVSLQDDFLDCLAGINEASGSGSFAAFFILANNTYIIEDTGKIFDAAHIAVVEVTGTPNVGTSGGHILLS